MAKTCTFFKKTAWIELKLHANELCIKATGCPMKFDILLILHILLTFTDYVKGLTSSYQHQGDY